jgi:hypothetical protein
MPVSDLIIDGSLVAGGLWAPRREVGVTVSGSPCVVGGFTWAAARRTVPCRYVRGRGGTPDF